MKEFLLGLLTALFFLLVFVFIYRVNISLRSEESKELILPTILICRDYQIPNDPIYYRDCERKPLKQTINNYD